MKSKGVLPDTCVWIEYFKSPTSRIGQRLEAFILNNNVFTCGPILYELVQGLKAEQEKVTVMNAFRALTYIEISEHLWMKAGELASTLRREGKTIPFSDILIAAVALEHQLSIFTEIGRAHV